MAVIDVPDAVCSPGMIRVRNHYSLISTGTEGSTVRAARSSLFDKARQRPEQVRQVFDLLARQGPVQAYRAVTKKLDSYSPLGYSSAGVVIEVGPSVTDFAAGDLVACAGAGYASHSEAVVVPVNLCVKLPPDANLRAASYNAAGSIALQGIRQADLRLGETCAVIGLGLIGQLTCLLLRAGGIRTFGIDISDAAVAFACSHTADFAWTRNEPGLADRIADLTQGLGADAVIITAGTSSLDPIDFSGEIARQRGRVVIVGAVPTGFQRENYYRKELELRMSCSYGPGRYDPSYEEMGLDYPPAYVRWTERRNMAAFQDLAARGRIDVDRLTTHEFPLEQAQRAYDLILNRAEPFLGVVLRYDATKPLTPEPIKICQPKASGSIGIGFIGAGSYAQSSLLPNLPRKDPAIVRKAVATSTGTTSRRVAEKFGFEYCTGKTTDIFSDPSIGTVFIATRHDAHARLVVDGLKARKNIFVEKPLALTEDELDEITEIYRSLASEGAAPALLVGFNRRFAPLAQIAKQALGSGPMSMVYRVNAGRIPPTHWIQDPVLGGGRIIGEACHFIDFLTFLCGAPPVRVFASALPSSLHAADTVAVNLDFANGSIGVVCYYANGSKALDKEYVEAYSSGVTATIRDFRRLEIAREKRVSKETRWSQDKGQKRMLAEFLSALKAGLPAPIAFNEIHAVTRATFAIERSLSERQPVSLI